MTQAGRTPPVRARMPGRLFALGKTAVLPGSLVAATGDLFAFVDGEVVVRALAIAAVLLCVVILAYLYRDRIPSPISWVLSGRTRLGGIELWDTARPWLSHGLHVPLVFAIVCFATSASTAAHSDEGGLIASHVALVRSAQLAMQGQLEDIHAEQKTTNALLANVKKETSDDPAKEIANRGRRWNTEDFQDAVRTNDLASVRLYAAGGMKMSSTAHVLAYRSDDAQLQAMLLPSAIRLRTARECRDLLAAFGPELRTRKHQVSQADFVDALPETQALFKAACAGNADFVAGLQSDVARITEQLAQQQTVNRQMLAYKVPAAECTSRHLRQGEVALMKAAIAADLASFPGQDAGYDFTRDLYRALRGMIQWTSTSRQPYAIHEQAAFAKEIVQASCDILARKEVVQSDPPVIASSAAGFSLQTPHLTFVDTQTTYYASSNVRLERLRLVLDTLGAS